jgi:hypothetical protein
MLRCNIRSNRSLNRFAFQIDYLFIKIAVKPRPSGRGCKTISVTSETIQKSEIMLAHLSQLTKFVGLDTVQSVGYYGQIK